MGKVASIKADSFFFSVVFFLGEKQKQKQVEEKRRKKHRESGKERERERERRKVEDERKEGSGVISALDWNLKVPGSIPSPTHRGIIHPKTTEASERR